MISTQQQAWQRYLLWGMMLINVLVLGSLVWRINQNLYQQQKTIQTVLRDYAAMAGQRLISRFKGQLGYGSMYQLSQLWSTEGDPTAVITQYMSQADDTFDSNHLRIKQALTNIQVIDIDAQHIHTIVHPQLKSAIASIPNLDTGNNYAFKALHTDTTSLSFSAVININSEYAVVADFHPELMADALQLMLQNQPMLPSVLNQTQDNSGLGFQLRSPTGVVVWQSSSNIPSRNQARLTIDDDYGGLFQGYQLSAVIEPSLAAQLVIGGLPYDQMPQLIGLLVVALCAMLAMFWIHLKLQKLHHHQQQFIARASHELKTPLTQIRLFAETLELGRVSDLDQQQHYLQVIHQESIRLSQLVENILYQNKIQQTQITTHNSAIELQPFFNELIAQQQLLWQAKNIQVKFDIEPEIEIFTDPDLLKQILINVLDNAVKFGPDQHHLGIKAERLTASVSIKISDQGPGIPKAQIANMLQSYQRLDRDEHRGINGNGLGLSIANSLTLKLGGQLSFEHPPKGLCVVISLPIINNSKSQEEP